MHRPILRQVLSLIPNSQPSPSETFHFSLMGNPRGNFANQICPTRLPSALPTETQLQLRPRSGSKNSATEHSSTSLERAATKTRTSNQKTKTGLYASMAAKAPLFPPSSFAPLARNQNTTGGRLPKGSKMMAIGITLLSATLLANQARSPLSLMASKSPLGLGTWAVQRPRPQSLTPMMLSSAPANTVLLPARSSDHSTISPSIVRSFPKNSSFPATNISLPL